MLMCSFRRPFGLDMLLTMSLSESESARWAYDRALRADLRLLARKLAAANDRRFFQIATESGIVAVGEVPVDFIKTQR